MTSAFPSMTAEQARARRVRRDRMRRIVRHAILLVWTFVVADLELCLIEAATDRRLIPHATIVAPAAPWIRRPTMIPAPPVESAMRAHEAMNSRSPPRNTRLRPNTSPRAPEVTMVGWNSSVGVS